MYTIPPVDFMTAMKNGFTNYINFSGRTRRSEFWWFLLPIDIISFILFLLLILYSTGAIQNSTYDDYYRKSSSYYPYPNNYYSSSYDNNGAIAALSVIYSLITFGVTLPVLAATVRRLHDIGKNGYFIFVVLVPLYGGITLLVLLCRDSLSETNEYGPSPKYTQSMTNSNLLQTPVQGIGVPLLQNNIIYQPNNNINVPNNNFAAPNSNINVPNYNINTNSINSVDDKPIPLNQVNSDNENKDV